MNLVSSSKKNSVLSREMHLFSKQNPFEIEEEKENGTLLS